MKCLQTDWDAADSLLDRHRQELHTFQIRKNQEYLQWLWLIRINLTAQAQFCTYPAAELQGRGSLKEVCRLEQNVLQKGKRWN